MDAMTEMKFQELVSRINKLTGRVKELERETSQDASARLIKKLKLDSDGKYMLFLPENLLSFEDTRRFSESLRALGFQCMIARLPDTRGIKVVEKIEKGEPNE